jgi:hypothetical protein
MNKRIPVIKYEPISKNTKTEIDNINKVLKELFVSKTKFIFILNISAVSITLDAILNIWPVIQEIDSVNDFLLIRCIIVIGKRNTRTRIKKKAINAALRIFKPKVPVKIVYDMPPDRTYLR